MASAIINSMEDETTLVKRQAYHDMYLLFPSQYFVVAPGQRVRFSEQLEAEAGAMIASEAPMVRPDTVHSLVAAYEDLLVQYDAPRHDQIAFDQSLQRLALLVNDRENMAAWQVTLYAAETAYTKLEAENSHAEHSNS